MSDYSPHPDDVTLASRALWEQQDEVTTGGLLHEECDNIAGAVLAAVGPAIGERIIDELAQAYREYRRDSASSIRYSYFDEWLDCYRLAVRAVSP